MKKHPFYAVLLLHTRFAVDEMCRTAYTDGSRIAFCPDFLNKLSEKELEFVLMHEVLHIALDHCGRMAWCENATLSNIACDIVVNSNILYSNNMDLSSISIKGSGALMHLAPDGKEGYNYTAEKIYEMLEQDPDTEKKSSDGNGDETEDEEDFDDHTFWTPSEDEAEDGSGLKEERLYRIAEAAAIAARIENQSGGGCGKVPFALERVVNELTNPQTDWRTALAAFVQEEINDYSFNPPDRRFQDSPFFLPDYNEKDGSVEDVLFMVDTSGSMTDELVTEAYSEICGAIRQFNGRLRGRLGFFDTEITEPKEFSDEDELRIIRPYGGGGTSFHCVFDYLKKRPENMNVVCLVILTDGNAPFPDESAAMGIPVLWIINNAEITPPWGKVIRIKNG